MVTVPCLTLGQPVVRQGIGISVDNGVRRLGRAVAVGVIGPATRPI